MDKQNNIVRDFNTVNVSKDGNKMLKNKNKWVVVFFASMLILGLISGYFLVGGGKDQIIGRGGGKIIKKEKIVGSTDSKIFKDSTEGILKKGGIDGEGTHHLVRKGGPDQTAYLTSSVIDMDQFVGKKVKVWGETFKAEKAGWLMDVGRLELLE
jgi:hypothetical protein